MDNDDFSKRFEDTDQKIRDFSDLLESIESTADKKKLLWKEIYENAITDRLNAYMLFTDAYTQMKSGTAEHVTLGSTMAKYLERMNKSNDQLLKLADIISDEEERSEKIDPEEIFKTIGD